MSRRQGHGAPGYAVTLPTIFDDGAGGRRLWNDKRHPRTPEVDRRQDLPGTIPICTRTAPVLSMLIFSTLRNGRENRHGVGARGTAPSRLSRPSHPATRSVLSGHVIGHVMPDVLRSHDGKLDRAAVRLLDAGGAVGDVTLERRAVPEAGAGQSRCRRGSTWRVSPGANGTATPECAPEAACHTDRRGPLVTA